MSSATAPAKARGLKKVLSAPQVIALSFGAMIGWSWVLLSANWVADAGFVLVGVVGTVVVTWANYVGIRTAAVVQTIATTLIVWLICLLR